MNILVLTNIIPAPVLTSKKRENDVLITSAEIHESMNSEVKYTFVFIIPYANRFLGLFKPKWKEFKIFKDLKKFNYKDREIEIVPVPNFREDGMFKSLLINIGYLMNKKKLKRIIEENKIDLIHAHNIKSNAGIANHLYKDYGIPYVVTTRKLGKVNLESGLKQYVTDAKAAISLNYRQKRLAELFNKNSFLIPHGIDQRFLTKEKVYQHDSGPLKLISVTRLLFWKNIDKVFLALEKVKYDFIYDIYGDGPEMENLKTILEASPIRSKVCFKGFIPYDDIPDTLASYDVFILPSFRELFGRVYIEAMACGLPVIASRGCGMDGYIENGVHGFLVNHLDIEEITGVIHKFMEDDHLKITMGKNAKALSNNFSWNQIIRKIDTIYKTSIMGSKGISNEAIIHHEQS
jgi:teichuronic acid biosynthesis glycosyltransferase TuaC